MIKATYAAGCAVPLDGESSVLPIECPLPVRFYPCYSLSKFDLKKQTNHELNIHTIFDHHHQCEREQNVPLLGLILLPSVLIALLLLLLLTLVDIFVDRTESKQSFV